MPINLLLPNCPLHLPACMRKYLYHFLLLASVLFAAPNVLAQQDAFEVEKASTIFKGEHLSTAAFVASWNANEAAWHIKAGAVAATISLNELQAQYPGAIHFAGNALGNAPVHLLLEAKLTAHAAITATATTIEVAEPIFSTALVRLVATERLEVTAAITAPEVKLNGRAFISVAEAITATGGLVEVFGNNDVQLLAGAAIDVSAATGGGNIYIGGLYQGEGTVNARTTFISPKASINASATEKGNGGTVIIWADGLTRFYGSITTEGGPNGGNGGFVEVSGKKDLVFRGEVSTEAAKGKQGTLLLDPENIRIVDGSVAPDDGEVGDNQILQGNGGTASFTISEQTLQALTGTVILEATNDITLEDLTDNALTFVNSPESIRFTANADFSGGGDFIVVDANDNIFTNGRSIRINGRNITIAGTIDTNPTLSGISGDIELRASDAGDINVGNLRSRNTHGTAAGNIEVDGAAGGDISITGNINSTSDGDGGDVDVRSFTGGNITIGASIQAQSTSGGQGGTVIIGSAGELAMADVNTTGANAGNISLTASGDLTALANLNASGVGPSSSGGAISITSINGSIVLTGTGTANTSGDTSSGSIGIEALNGSVSSPANYNTTNAVSAPSLSIRSSATSPNAVTLTTIGFNSVGDLFLSGHSIDAAGVDFTVNGTAIIRAAAAGTGTVAIGNLNGTGDSGADITIEAPENITVGSIGTGGSIYGGSVDISSLNGDLAVGGISTSTVSSSSFPAGPVTLDVGGDITAISFISAINGASGTSIDINQAGSAPLVLGNINLSNESTGGNLTITTAGALTTGNITANATASGFGNGGTIDLASGGALTTGHIRAEGDDTGGEIILEAASGNIQFTYLSAEATDAFGPGGGDITLTTTGNIVGTGSLTSSYLNQGATISSYGVNGSGTITILHNTTPTAFVVGATTGPNRTGSRIIGGTPPANSYVNIPTTFSTGTFTSADGKVIIGINADQVTLTSSSPTANALAAPTTTDITLTFDEPLSGASANSASVVVAGEQSGPIAATSSYSVSGNTLTIDPSDDFAPGERVRVSITENLMGTSANSATPYTFEFFTRSLGGVGFSSTDLLIASLDNPRSVEAADLDGDGHLDVLSISRNIGTINWYSNDGPGTGTFSPETAISNSFTDVSSAYAADFDGDGLLDVVAATDEITIPVTWFRNNGAGSFVQQPALPSATFIAEAVLAADLDNDGDQDIIGYSSSTIFWYANDGSGTFTAQPQISGSISLLKAVHIADIDHDGALDILIASSGNDVLSWYKNDGSGAFGTQNSIQAGVDSPYDVTTGDVDGDGFTDVIGGFRGDQRIIWYKGNGTGSFSAQTDVESSFAVDLVRVADLDGDGDLDVLAGSGTSTSAKWYRNNGSGSFTNVPTDFTALSGASDILAADIDSDGDLDVLASSGGFDKVVWFENLGTDVTLTTLAPVIGNAAQGSTDNVLYSFSALASADIDLIGVTLTSSASYTPSDIDEFEIWVSPNSDLSSPTLLGSETTIPVSGNSFTINFSDALTAGTPKYYFLTADIDAGATIGNLVTIDLPDFADFDFSVSAADNSSTLSAGEFVVIAPPAGEERPLGNTGIYFDGVDDYVVVPDNNAIDLTGNDITLEAWIKPNAATATGGTQRIISKPAVSGYGLSLVDNTQLFFTIYGHEDYSASVSLQAGSWYHVAVSSRAGALPELYVNGQAVVHTSLTNAIAIANTNVPLYIGSRSMENESFNGQIDEVRLFNSALTQAKIQLNMYDPTDAGAAAYWWFDDGSGTTAIQNVGPAVTNGTLTGATDLPLWAFRVTDTADSGPGSFREALTQANNNADKNFIDFSIPGAGVQTITPTTADLPAITAPVIIDGYTQRGSSVNTLAEGNNANLLIEVRGSVGRVRGLFFNSGSNNSKLSGVVINGFSDNNSDAITVSANNVSVIGSFIGTNTLGTTAVENYTGIRSFGASAIFGTPLPADRNLISGNVFALSLGGTGPVTVQNNYIGTDASGNATLRNTIGVSLFGSNALVGGTTVTARNVISGNFQNNIFIGFASAFDNTILGNYIGLRADGTAALTTFAEGIWFSSVGPNNNTIGGIASGEANTITGAQDGIQLVASGANINNSFRGNSIYGNTLKGIDIGAGTNDADDADAGTNNLQNFPVISTVVESGSNLIVNYAVPTAIANATYPLAIDFYASTAGQRQGRRYLGTHSYLAANATNAVTITLIGVGLITGETLVATATDANGNTSEFSAEASLTTASLLSLTLQNSAITNASTAPVYQAVFDVPVSGLSPANFSGSTTGTLSGFSFTVSPLSAPPVTTWNISVNGLTGDGDFSLSLANTASVVPTISSTLPFTSADVVTVDRTDPTVTLSSPVSPTGASPIIFNITFSEEVAGLIESDFTITNGSASAGTLTTSNDIDFVLSVTPASTGAVSVALPASVVTDIAGNTNAALPAVSVNYNPTPPTLTITSSESSPTNATSIPLSFTFSEAVTGFASTDITVSGANLVGFTGTGDTYTATLNTIIEGTVTVNVAANAAQNAATVGNAAATFSIVSDQTAPVAPSTAPALTTATDTGISDTDGITNFGTAGNPLNFTVSGINGEQAQLFINASPVTGATATIVAGNAIITGVQLAEGSYTATYTLTDAAGNTSTASVGSTIVVDRTAPTAGISSPGPNPTGANPIQFDIAFSEEVAGLIESDFTITNGSASAGTLTTSNDIDFVLSVTPASTGAVSVALPASVVTDIAGNTNAALPAVSVNYNPTPPTLTITSSESSPTNATSIPLSFTFSEAVTGFASTDITVSGANLVGFTGTGDTYTATLNTIIEGTVTVNVAANAAQNAATVGNAAATFSIVSDQTAPVAPSTAPALTTATDTGISDTDGITNFGTAGNPLNFTVSGTNGEQAQLFINASPVTGATATIVAGNAIITGVQLAEGSYTATYTLTDAAGNTSIASTGGTITVDRTLPTAPTIPDLATADDTGDSDTDNITSATTVTLTATVGQNERIRFIDSGNSIDITEGPTSPTCSPCQLSTTLSSLAEGTYEVNSVAIDAAGNQSVSSGFTPFIVDTTPPTVSSFSLESAYPVDATSVQYRLTASEALAASGTPSFGVNAVSGTVSAGPAAVDAGASVPGSGYFIANLPITSGSGEIRLLYSGGATDIAGNALASGTFSDNHTVNLTPAVVTTDIVTAGGTYGISNTLTFDVEFSANVDVVGVPELRFSVGGTSQTALYVSGTGSSTLRFEYSVVAPPPAFNGIVINEINDLLLNPGVSIKRSSSTDDANLVIPSNSFSDVFIDNFEPAPAAPDLIASDDMGASDTDNITFATSFDLTVTGTNGHTVQFYRDPSSPAMTTVGSPITVTGGVATFTQTTLTEGTYYYRAITTDVNGNVSSFSPELAVEIDLTAPSVTIDFSD